MDWPASAPTARAQRPRLARVQPARGRPLGCRRAYASVDLTPSTRPAARRLLRVDPDRAVASIGRLLVTQYLVQSTAHHEGVGVSLVAPTTRSAASSPAGEHTSQVAAAAALVPYEVVRMTHGLWDN